MRSSFVVDNFSEVGREVEDSRKAFNVSDASHLSNLGKVPWGTLV